MGRKYRTELSPNNPYYISKHRRLELEHFCKQYNEWKEELKRIDYISSGRTNLKVQGGKSVNTVEDVAIKASSLNRRCKMIEEAARTTDPELAKYIILAVTSERSYANLKTVYDIPCCAETFSKRRQKFYYILDKLRD